MTTKESGFIEEVMKTGLLLEYGFDHTDGDEKVEWMLSVLLRDEAYNGNKLGNVVHDILVTAKYLAIHYKESSRAEFEKHCVIGTVKADK